MKKYISLMMPLALTVKFGGIASSKFSDGCKQVMWKNVSMRMHHDDDDDHVVWYVKVTMVGSLLVASLVEWLLIKEAATSTQLRRYTYN